MKKISFFGRRGCKYSDQALTYLRLLGADVSTFSSTSRSDDFPDEVSSWEGDLIVCFRSYLILPIQLIERATCAAINFHPGPPKHPGTGCINFALYEDDTEFGCTAHLMDNQIDSGKILKTRMFPILKSDTVETLLERTHHELLSLFYETINTIYESKGVTIDRLFSNEGSGFQWARKARTLRDLNNLQYCSHDISREELEKRVRATHTQLFPTSLKLHGYIFELNLSDKSYP